MDEGREEVPVAPEAEQIQPSPAEQAGEGEQKLSKKQRKRLERERHWQEMKKIKHQRTQDKKKVIRDAIRAKMTPGFTLFFWYFFLKQDIH